jgi:cytochrome c553
MRGWIWLLILGMLAATGARGEPDLALGEEINRTCAGCHGDLGQGGKKGEYPRIAGLHPSYLKDQLRKFRSRERVNIPMFPYTAPRELTDHDIDCVAAYLGRIELSSKPPEFGADDDALAKLKAMDRVMRIPRAEGDVEAGAALYRTRCQSCHGADGRGKGGVFPMLSGQYTPYLQRQIQAFIKGERVHDEDKKDILDGLGAEQIRDILAFVTTLQD